MTGSRLAWLPVFSLFAACSAFEADASRAPSTADGGTSSSSSSTSSSGGASSSGSASSGSSSGLVDAGAWDGCGLTPFEPTLDTVLPKGMIDESDTTGKQSVIFSKATDGLRVSIASAGSSAQHALVYAVDKPACLQLRERITLDQKPAAPGYKLTMVQTYPSHNFMLVILSSAESLVLQAVEQDTTVSDTGYQPLGSAAITPMTPHDIVFEYHHGDTLPSYALWLDGVPVTLSTPQFQHDNPTSVRVGAPYVDPGGAGSYVLHDLVVR
jgi:hypothetical protein